jgi:hypothetical protein
MPTPARSLWATDRARALARLEYRRDIVDCNKADCSFFADSSGPIGDGGEESNDIGILELVYSFD